MLCIAESAVSAPTTQCFLLVNFLREITSETVWGCEVNRYLLSLLCRVEELSLKDEQHLSINRHLDTAVKTYMEEVAHLKQANTTAQARIEELASLNGIEKRQARLLFIQLLSS